MVLREDSEWRYCLALSLHSKRERLANRDLVRSRATEEGISEESF